MGVLDYSTTPASNTTINAIAITGGSSPAGFDNALRQLMADIAAGIAANSFVPAAGDLAAIEALATTAYGRGLLTSADAATLFASLKQAASDSATGVVELATDAETQTGTDTARAITPANLTAKEATVTNYRANTADRLLTTDIVWSAMAEVSLSDAATITLDLSTGIDFTVTLSGNRTLGNATNVKVGQRGRIRIVQDGAGSRTLAYGTSYEFINGSAPVLSTAIAAEDVLYYDCISATRILCSLSRAIS